MSDYKSWEQREAEARLTNAQAEQAKVSTEQARIDLAGNAAATKTRQAREELAQLRVRQQIAEQHEAGREKADAAKRRRAEERADSGRAFKLLVRVFVAVCMAAALPAQFGYFLGLHAPGQHGAAWALGPVPVVLELAAWVSVCGTAWARRKGLPLWPFWSLTAGLASFAAWINYGHTTAEYGSIAGWALAASSFAGPLMWELAEHLDNLAAVDARSREQRAADKKTARQTAEAQRRREEHEAKRSKLFPAVHTRFVEILAANPLGTVEREKAWAQAWDDVHRAPLGVTAETYKARVEAEQRLESVMDPDGDRSVYKTIDALLGDIFGGDDDGGIPALPEDPSGKPSGGPSQARTTLVRKGKQPSSTGSHKTPQRPLDPEHIERVRKLAEALGGKDKLSLRNVREAIGGGSNEYAVRLRTHVQGESN